MAARLQDASLALALLLTPYSLSHALSCAPTAEPSMVADHRHIFLAEIGESTETSFANADGSHARQITATLEVLDTIKGNPEEVPFLTAVVGRNPGEAAHEPRLPLGDYYYLVFAEQDGPVNLGGCSPTRAVRKDEARCVVYQFRQDAQMDPAFDSECEVYLKQSEDEAARAAKIRARIEERRRERGIL